MAMTAASVDVRASKYLRAPVPVRFPEAELVPESKTHLDVRTLLYEILRLSYGAEASIGSDQFVYWDPTEPRACLAPDAFVRLGIPDHAFRSWRVWERGAPEVCVEIVSASDEWDRDWDEKLERYRRLGVKELVRFEPESEPPSLRVWNQVEGDLVERELGGLVAPSHCLAGAWVVVKSEGGPCLRLSRDREGNDLISTFAERSEAERQRADRERERADEERRAAENERRAAENERKRADQADRERIAAEARVRELEEELRRRG
jgi:hypothetical protein